MYLVVRLTRDRMSDFRQTDILTTRCKFSHVTSGKKLNFKSICDKLSSVRFVGCHLFPLQEQWKTE